MSEPDAGTDAKPNGSHPPVTVTEAALAIAASGIPVFPCGADKKPLTEHSFKDASTDPDKVRKWFINPEAKLVGIPTGQASGFDVLDLDPRHGSDAWRTANIQRLPETLVHQTGGVGEHWVFQHHDGVRNIQDNKSHPIGAGVDVRGEGGYAIWPNSPGYTVVSDADVAPWPGWLLEQVLKREKPKSERPTFTPQQRTEQLAKRHQGYVNSLLDNVRAAPDGTKHDALLRNARAMGGILKAAGISETDAHQWLMDALPATVKDWNNASRTATDGLRHGIQEPYDLADRPRPNGSNGQHYVPRDPPPDEPPPPDPESAQDTGAVPPEPPGVEDPIDAVIERFNAKFMMVNENGKAVIYQPGYDPVLKRRRFDRLMTGDLMTLYMNEKVMVGVNSKKKPVYKCVADAWLHSPNRRQFIGGMVFDPSQQCAADVLNLWQGFAIQPAPGDWSLMREHIEKVVCGGDPVRYNYLIRWIARMFRRPGEQGEVAVVMKGSKGSGKGTLAKVLLRIVGHHGIAISQAKHLTGSFNGHLRDAILLFADEALFAGDRQHIGVLNSLITEPYLTIEVKFANAVQAPNFLHVIMASNEEWVVPASLDERRYLVLSVSDKQRGNHAYFGAIWQQMQAGGYAAMLHDLLAMDLTDFNVRNVPDTDGLQEQRKLSLPVPERWWLDVLHRGYVFRSKLGLEAELGKWLPDVSTELLFNSYEEFARLAHERRPMSREALGRFMVKMRGLPKRLYDAPTGEHITDVPDAWGSTHRKAAMTKRRQPPGYALGSLQLARVDFCSATGLTVAWEDEDGEP